MDEIERELGMEVVPFTWPVGMGKSFHGVMDLREKQMRVFKPGEDRDRDDDEILAGLDNPAYAERFGMQYEQAEGEIELLADAAPPFDREAFLAGQQTPMFFGSAVNNFGVREVLDALVDLAPPPADRGGDAAHRPARRAEVQRRGVQDPGQHGPGAPRPDRLRARRLGPLRARHAAEGRALGQGAAAEHGGELPVAAARAARRGLRRRHHRHPEPRRAAARRHAHRRRGAAVHRPAVLRARDVPLGRGRRPAAHQAAARRPDPARRGRRDPGVPSGRRHGAAARRGRPAAVRGGGAPARARVRRQGADPCRRATTSRAG